MPEPLFDLKWLIDPIGKDVFVQSHWESKPLRISREAPSYFSQLGCDDLEFLLRAACDLDRSAVEEIGDKAPRPCQDYFAARQAFCSGKSIRIRAVSRFSDALSIFCRALEQEFSLPVGLNAYITPPGEKALGRHFDRHDVFVLQIAGKKRWKVYQEPLEFPLETVPRMAFEDRKDMEYHRVGRQNRERSRDEEPELLDSCTLEPGDLYYIPRGYIHEAESDSSSISYHLTAGIQAVTYIELLTLAIARFAGTEPACRRSLPVGFATHASNSVEIGRCVATLADKFAASIETENALEELCQAFFRSRRTLKAGLFDQHDNSAELSLQTVARVRPGMLSRVVVRGEHTMIAFDYTVVEFPRSFEPVLRFISANTRFAVGELPGDLTNENKILLAKKLVTEGLLMVESSACV